MSISLSIGLDHPSIDLEVAEMVSRRLAMSFVLASAQDCGPLAVN